MSPYILRQLLERKRVLLTRYNVSTRDEQAWLEHELWHDLTMAGLHDRQRGEHYHRSISPLKFYVHLRPYIKYQEESEREYEAQMANGGRTICPKCGERSLTSRTVCTYGYPGHPGADYSALYECHFCDYVEM